MISIACNGVLIITVSAGIPGNFWKAKSQKEYMVKQLKKEQRRSTHTMSGISDSPVPTPAKSVASENPSELIDIKFREGTEVGLPEKLLPPDLRNSVSHILRVSTLSDEELERMGAGKFKLWFRITLKPGTDAVSFLETLKRLESVESAQYAPLPAPPPG